MRCSFGISCVFLFFALLAQAQAPPGGAQKARDFNIDSITIEGARILSAKAITAAAELKTGAPGSTAIFDAARDRLLATGYFDSVSYRFRTSQSGGFDLSFDVAEITQLFPLRVEGLPVTTADAAQYLKANDPLFTGRVPGTQPAIERTTRELEALLASRNTPAKILGKVIAAGPNQFEVDFTPPNGLPPVASVAFEGSKLITAMLLQNRAAAVAFGQPYTEAGFRILLENQIRPLYESKGHLRVTFPKIVATPSPKVRGMDVTVTVDEGPEYKLTRVAVTGRSARKTPAFCAPRKSPT